MHDRRRNPQSPPNLPDINDIKRRVVGAVMIVGSVIGAIILIVLIHGAGNG